MTEVIEDLHKSRDEPYRTVETLYGFRWPEFHHTIEDAVRRIDGARQAELVGVNEFVPGARTLDLLAIVLEGEWYINDEELTMVKVKAATAGRDVAKDLLGDDTGRKKNGTKTKPAKSGKPKASSAYEEKQKIVVLKKDKEFREGSNNAKIFDMAKRGKTIGGFLALRKKAKMDPGLGGVFGTLVRDKIVKVV